MSRDTTDSLVALKPSWGGTIVIFLAVAAVVVRTVALDENRPHLSMYLGLELVYSILFIFALWKYTLPGWLMHLTFGLQSALVLWMLSIRPEFDFVVLLLALLTYPVSLAFAGRERWLWVGILVLLIGGPLMVYLGALRGLALSLTTIAADIVIPTYLQVNQEIETARVRSQELLSSLQDAHQKLKDYALQAEELAAVQERNRLARELHDTVSQHIFSISLTTRSAQLLLEKDPQRVTIQLRNLQAMTTDTLSQLRSLITQLRPPQKS